MKKTVSGSRGNWQRISILCGLTIVAATAGIWSEALGQQGVTHSRYKVRGGSLSAYVYTSTPSTNTNWTNVSYASASAFEGVTQDGNGAPSESSTASVYAYANNWDNSSWSPDYTDVSGNSSIPAADFLPTNPPVNRPTALDTTIPGYFYSQNLSNWTFASGPVDIDVTAALIPGTETDKGPFRDTQTSFNGGDGGASFYRFSSRGVGATNYDPSGSLSVAVAIPAGFVNPSTPNTPISGGSISYYNTGSMTISK